MPNQTKLSKPIYVVDGVRTPFIKSRNVPGPFAASDLAVAAGRELLSRVPIKPSDIGETVIGCMMPSQDEANIGRLIGLRLGLGKHVPGWTVQRNCASGMQALDSAIKDILSGRHDLVLAGGTETMSRAPLILRPKMAAWLTAFNGAKTMMQKMQTLTKLRPAYFAPIISLIHGLTDPLCGMNMGQTAEEQAFQFGITREDMDAFAVQSQKRAYRSQQDHVFDDEIVPIYDDKGQPYTLDNGVRSDSSMQSLAKLKPFFDRKYGMVTPANSSQITDGAALLLLASEEAVKAHQLPVLGKIVDVQWAALEPEVMGYGPIFSSTPLLTRNKLNLSDVDYWEINEAFAAQVIACLRAWEDDTFCQTHLGLDNAMGAVDMDRLNVDGGAIALGHPVGATGARLVLHLLNTLKRQDAKRGVATLCIGGGQGGAMLLER